MEKVDSNGSLETNMLFPKAANVFAKSPDAEEPEKAFKISDRTEYVEVR